MADPALLAKTFQDLYGKKPRIFSAPGRVNLIGEHTDYNEGFVLPMALNRRTYVAATGRNDRTVSVQALDVNDRASFNLDEPLLPRSKPWLFYVAGVAFELEQRRIHLRGADLVIASEVPIGAGLSSSAALEISVGKSLLAVADRELDATQLALAAQHAEHVYAGTQCGIMDQLTATSGKREHALLIDCRSLDVTHILLNLPDVSVVVCNTNVKHELASSAYNERRAECERCVLILTKRIPGLRTLRDLSMADFERYASDLPEPLRRRCCHVVTEIRRTLDASIALREGDLTRLGELMRLSHESLRNDYEVSCAELDTMVELALKQEGVFGARMTGGGFGGSTVNIVRREKVPQFTESITREYRERTKIEPSIYVVEADDGVKETDW